MRAIGMYDRSVALRTRDRLRELGDFAGTVSSNEPRRSPRDYDLDYLVTERTLALPLAFRAGALRVYRLR